MGRSTGVPGKDSDSVMGEGDIRRLETIDYNTECSGCWEATSGRWVMEKTTQNY